jgi:Ca2+-binding RTX toxin-like protein
MDGIIGRETMRAAAAFSIGVLVAASVAILSPATALADSCSYDPTTHTVAISYSGPAPQGEADNEVKAVAGQITFEDTPCSGATVTNTDTINATGGGGRDLFSIDIGGGPLAPGFTDEGDGTSEIEIHVIAGGGADVVIIEGTALRDFLVAGADGLNLNGDSDADVFPSATENLAMFGSGGNDVLTAGGGFGTGGAAGTHAVLVGRGGNDRLLGGRVLDDLVGGRGRDIAKGGRGGDLLVGQGDADKLFGQGQNDFLAGGGGRDRLVGGSGTDMCRQGPGTGPLRSCEET